VGIAQAIVHGPKLVFLDEPMSGLDPIGRREVRDLIASLKDEGKTVFFSTHILSDAEALCDRVAVLNKGRLRGIGVIADLTSQVSGRMELLWQGEAAMPAIRALGGEPHFAGDTVRVVLPEPQLDAALECLRRSRTRLISVTPVRSTLEDYFVEKLAEAAQPDAEGVTR
jgi:ABC-2 type transport system ATP-binding protein